MRTALTALAILGSALVMTGCVDVPGEAPAPTSPTDADLVVDPAPCEPAPTTLLEWSAPDQPQDAPEEHNFTLGPGSRNLHVAWTDPEAMAGSIELRLTDPEGAAIFELTLGVGASAAGSNVSGFGVSKSGPEDVPVPLAGEYGWYAFVQGSMPGAAMTVTADACGA